MTTISGTFSGTGQSDQWCNGSAVVILDFAGTASVSIEAYDPVNGNWVAISTKTADYAGVLEGFGKVQCRLNCTAHTNDVDYYVAA